MTTQTGQGTLAEQQRVLVPGMVYHDSLETMRHDRGLLPYVASVERAWSVLGLTGALFIDGRPALYVKREGSRPFQPAERLRLHRLFWNQGIANVLVLLDPTTAYLYSGLATPLQEQDTAHEERVLVERLKAAEYAERMEGLFHDIATGHYYRGAHENWFSPKHGVDAYLLGNLSALRDELTEGESGLAPALAHAFLGRLLFLCYLADRGMISDWGTRSGRAPSAGLGEHVEGLGSHAKRLEFLYGLFGRLKTQFNGSMFDGHAEDLAIERSSLRESHLGALIGFLRGHEVRTRQGVLDFWAYNFAMVPVETISAIYEDFLEKEDETGKRRSGAFYTPRFLAEMTVDACTEGRSIEGMRFLDPACGSGVFLVILFGRLATRWRLDHPQASYEERAEALQHILRTQIRGVDKAETACRIACFSLYLAYLDCFEPRDIQSYVDRIGKPLPKLLDYGGEQGRPIPDIPVVCKGDSIGGERLFAEPFDAVIGNPPWEGRSSNQLAQKFAEEAPRYLKPGGLGCLLLPSKLLLNAQSNAFQTRWLRQVTVEKVVQLADYSFLLFEHGKCPCTLVRFAAAKPAPNDHVIEFAAPKFSRATQRRGAIAVHPADRAWLPLRRILAAADADSAPLEWKRHLWGTPRDQKLLDLLLAMPPLSDMAGPPSSGKRWCKGQGFQPDTFGRNPKAAVPWWSPADLFIGARSSVLDAGLVLLDSDCERIGMRFLRIHRCRDRRVFRPPMVLVSQGFGKVAFCDFPVLFQDSLQSIGGPEQDADLLVFLAAYLRSNLAKYFLFHTAGNWGAERDKVHLVELLRVPFPLPGSEFAPAEHQAIIAAVAAKVRGLRDEIVADLEGGKLLPGGRPDAGWQERRAQRTAAVQAELEPIIYRYFGLTDQEIVLVEDTLDVAIPSSTPASWDRPVPAQEPAARSGVPAYRTGLKPYADTLTATLNGWAKDQGSSYRVAAEGGSDDRTGLALVTVRLADGTHPFRRREVSTELAAALQSYARQATQRAGTLEYPRDILLFDGPSIHIIRPGLLANWTRAAALNDAARIYADIAERRRGGPTAWVILARTPSSSSRRRTSR